MCEHSEEDLVVVSVSDIVKLVRDSPVKSVNNSNREKGMIERAIG